MEKHWNVSNLLKIHSVGNELFHADKWTDIQAKDRQKGMTDLIVACRKLANAFKHYPGIWLEGKRKDTIVTVKS